MKRNIPVVYLLLFVLLALGSCTKTLPLPEIKSGNKIVLLGELVTGEPCYIRAGQSAAVTSSNGGPITFEILSNLSVSLNDSTGNTYDMYGQEDDYTQMLYTVPYSIDTPAMEGGVYTVTAIHSKLGTATVKVRIPAQIQAEVVDTASELYATDNTLKVKIRLKDPGNTTNYYVIEALKQVMRIDGYFFYDNNWYAINDDTALYRQLKTTGNAITRFDTAYFPGYLRQSIYTADRNSENVIDNGSLTSSRRILIKDNPFNGTNYETTVYVVNEAPDSMIDQRGQVVIYIKSVSEEYFRFLKSYEVFLPTLGSSATEQPVKIQGNVQNGYGMIGGVSQVKFSYIRDTWSF